MKSQNFEFLRSKSENLADLAAFAERYAHSDPASSLIKQRSFVEQVVIAIYGRYRLEPPYSDNLNDLLNAESFRQSVPEVVQHKLHTVRKAGNHAAHPRRPITSTLSLDCLSQLFDIARWYHVQIDGGKRQDAPDYSPPSRDGEGNGKARLALEKLRLAEAKYEAVLASLEDGKAKRLAAERAATEHATELSQFKEQGQKVASVLQFSEETTRRRLIDQALFAAGWDAGENGRDTHQVHQEVRLSTMPTGSGEGFADYVLYGDDGKPLAVIEAKKTAKDARVGAEQARIYAGCLEKETGVRPVIFFTNGVDIFLWDDAQGYPYRKVYGFYSKDSLEYLTHQRANKKALVHVAPSLAIAGRMYQLEALATETQETERATVTWADGPMHPLTGRHAPTDLTEAWEKVAVPEEVLHRVLEADGDGYGVGFDRYVLTDLGGVSLGVGFDAGGPAETDDLLLLPHEQYARRWAQFAEQDGTFELGDSPVSVECQSLSSTGRADTLHTSS